MSHRIGTHGSVDLTKQHCTQTGATSPKAANRPTTIVWNAGDCDRQTLCCGTHLNMDKSSCYDGVQVIAWMRERYSEALVFVMCTARSQSTAKKLAATAKAQGYLCKPYTMKELLAVLSELKIPHLPNVPLNAKMTKSDASETQRDVCPSTQAFNQGFAMPKVPLGTLVRTAASALQGCQAALTTLGSRSTCGSSGSDAGRSVRTADHFQSDGMSTTIQTTAMDRDRASVRLGGASAASPHSSFDVNDTPCGATMSDALRLKEYANVGYRADRTFPSQFNKGRVVDSGMRHAGHSHHINEAVTSIGQVLQQGMHKSLDLVTSLIYHTDTDPLQNNGHHCHQQAG